MQENINLDEINDIDKLKIMKSDQYDGLLDSQTKQARHTSNLEAINTRILQIQQKADTTTKPTKEK